MLSLFRKVGDSITIGDAVVTVLKLKGGGVRLGVTAPRDVPILWGG